MTVALFDTAQVGAVADAIRAKTGKSALMTVGEMPAEIASIAGSITEREVWLHAQTKRTSLMIDTGIAGDMEHTIEIIGYGNIYSTSTLIGSIEGTAKRQLLDLLTTSMKVRFAWANSGLQAYEYPISEFSCWHPAKYRFNKSGFTINGFNSSFNAVTLTGDYSATVTGPASTANYFIFPFQTRSSPPGNPGVFRSAKIYGADGVTLLHELVPILYSDWTLALRDKVTGIEQTLPLGANGYDAYYAPDTDSLMGL